MSRLHWRSDRGETLVEVLVSVMILGVAGVAIVSGLMMSVQASDSHRKQTTGGAYVRSFAEAIQDYVATSGTNHYQGCAGADYYTGKVSLGLPAGFTPVQEAAKSVNAAGAASACASDPGL